MPARAGDWDDAMLASVEVKSAAAPTRTTNRHVGSAVMSSARLVERGQVLDEVRQIGLRHRSLETLRHERDVHALPLDDGALRHAALDSADELHHHLVVRLARDHADELLAVLRADRVPLVPERDPCARIEDREEESALRQLVADLRERGAEVGARG